MKYSGLTGRVVSKDDSDYEVARRVKNGRISSYPDIIVYCETPQDAVNALRWALKCDKPFCIRSGGHSYEGFSVLNNSLVIDVSEFSSIKVDPDSSTVRVGAGVLIGNLQEYLAKYNLIVSAGSCSTVGIAGLALGGGFGLISRQYGLTCDNVESMSLIDAAGNFLTANANENPDLFWACRGGGGGSFGILNSLVLKTIGIGAVSRFSYTWPWDEALQIVKTFQQWGPFVDDRLTALLTLSRGPGPVQAPKSLKCFGKFLGDQSELERLLEPLLSVGHPSGQCEQVSSIDALRDFLGINLRESGMQQNKLKYLVHLDQLYERFKNTSDYAETAFTDEAIKRLISVFDVEAAATFVVQFDSYGGAVNRIAPDATAFCHRKTLFSLQYQSYWDSAAADSQNLQWISNTRKTMKPFVTGQCYVNYCDADIKDWERSYFGANLDRLREVKFKYDPSNVFNFPQSIRLPFRTN